ncbi:MAG TPA: formyltransferase family protein, partial [Trueperaceae bacterium]|nr:formyltransferase family protein [Trueperaceae bacterium]
MAQEAAGVRALRLLAGSDCSVVAVFTSEEPQRGAVRGASVEQLATQLGYPVWPAADVRGSAVAAELRAAGVDLLLNVYSLFVIHPAVIAAPRIGAFNLHPGPLPRFAGLNVPSWAILEGERSFGVTLHWLTPLIDAGPIAYTASFEVLESHTGLSLSARCVESGIPLVGRLLGQAREDPGGIPRIEQDASLRRYFGRERPFGGRLRWSLDAATLVNFVRACDYRPFESPWGQPLARLGNEEIGVVKVERTFERCSRS